MAEQTEKTRRRPDRKEIIREKAAELIARQGFHGTTIQQIASAVGIAPGALYRHYDNKQSLLNSILHASFDVTTPAGGEAESLDELLRYRAHANVASPYAGFVWVRESPQVDDQQRRELVERIRALHDRYTELLTHDRPDLSADDTAFLSWAVESVLAASSLPIGMSSRNHADLLIEILRVIVQVDLPAEPDGLPHVQAPLQPLSTRERILAAATSEFARFGMHSASMTGIGQRAHVTGPSIYSHYRSKEALMIAVVQRFSHAMWHAFTTVLQRSESAREGLNNSVDAYIRIARTNPDQLKVVIADSRHLPEEYLNFQTEYGKELRKLLKESRPELLEEEARLLVRATIGAINFLTMTRVLRDRDNWMSSIRAIADAILFTTPAPTPAPASASASAPRSASAPAPTPAP